MSEAILKRIGEGFIVDPAANDAEMLASVHMGEVIKVKWSKPRNINFHRKFFALLGIGFDAFEPAEAEYRGMPVQKNRERFRKDVIIAAGYFDAVANIKGEVRAEAKSISFAKMDEDEFNKLYNACVNVLLQRVLKNYTRDDLDQVVEQLIRF
ncbi:DUF1367 family protein [Alteromonadaceae bacterium M269]|nr:DUF1367 family protein [Alteromonadaceae bacterium M269]